MKRITWVVAAMWLAGVVASCAMVLLVSHGKGGLLVSRPAPTIEIRAAQTSEPVDLGPLWVETTACNVGLAEVRWQLNALLPHAWPDRSKLPTMPRGAMPPERSSTWAKAGSGRKWKRGGW